MLDNGVLGQFRAKPRFSARRGRAKWRFGGAKMVRRVVERALGLCTLAGCYIHRSFSAAVYLIGGGRGRKGSLCGRFVATPGRPANFFCTSPRGNVCILLRDFWFKSVPQRRRNRSRPRRRLGDRTCTEQDPNVG